jgi:nitrous oxidase accessory protein
MIRLASRCAVAIAVALLTATSTGGAATHRVPAGAGVAPRVLAAAAAGDTVLLGSGVHAGALRVERAIVLRGEPGAVVDGGGHATVVEIVAPGTVIEDLEVRGSGHRPLTVDSGIHVVTAEGVTLQRLVLRDVLYGIYGERAAGLRVAGCRLTGRVTPLDESGQGNGIHLWYTDDARIDDTTVERFLDGVYLSFANGTRVDRSVFVDCGRYGLHTMYCQQNTLVANRFTRNIAGCAIMFSNHLDVRDNDFVHNRGPRTYGLLLRDCSDGSFVGNRIVDNTVAIFMDNSNRNRVHENLFENNGWGLLVFSSCADNETARNVFVNNDYPVALDMRRTNNRFDDGSRGNFWSGAEVYDLDGDGVGDTPHSPVGAFAFLSKQYPDLAVLSKSPAVAALGVAERVLPALRPSEAVDRHPLIAPPPIAPGGPPLVRAPHGVAWRALAGFGALAVAGLLGAVGGLRR